MSWQIVGQVVVSGLLLGGVYALISIGLTLIFGVIRIINFAHGEFLMVSMYITFWMFHYWGWDPYFSLIFVTAILFLFGLVMHRAIIQPLLEAPPFMQIFATFGLSIALQGAALFFWKADYRTVQTAYSTSTVGIGPLILSTPRLIAFIVALGITLLLFWFLKHSYVGKAIRAVSQDREAAQLMGIDIGRMYLITFSLGAACAGVAGALLMPSYYAFPMVGTNFVLAAFVIVVLGGMGNMTGAFVGALLIGVIEAFSGVFIAPQLKEAIYFAIFILVLLFKPSGLFGIAGAEEVGLK